MLFSRRKTRLISLFFYSIFVLCASGVLPVKAEGSDYFTRGCQYYQAGHYEHAQKCFEYIAKKSPKHWPSHYQLANTYMKLGKNMEARAAYDACIHKLPDRKTFQACQAAIKAIDSDTAKREIARMEAERLAKEGKEPEVSAPEPVKSVQEKLADAQDERVRANIKELKAKRDAILEEGRNHAARIRARAEREIDDFARNTNQYIQNSRTGEVRLGITSDQARRIRVQAEEEARRAINTAEIRARGIRIPKEPD